MSSRVEGQSCPVCHAYLFSEDDVVFCPECGAPHHRDCYKSLGHCALEQYHGTPEQYDRKKHENAAGEIPPVTPPHQSEEEKTVCPNCKAEYARPLPRCPECGMPNFERGNVYMIDMLGGVPKDFDIGEGVTADKAKNFVAASTNRIIPRFAAFKNGQRFSWNWGAFIIPSAYFAFRKMYKNALFAFLAEFAASLLTLPFSTVIDTFSTSDVKTYQQLTEAILSNTDKIPVSVFILTALGILLNIGIRVVCALTADKSYYNRVITMVKDIEENSDDKAEDYRRYGGVNIFTFAIFLFALYYIVPTVITLFMR